LEANKDRAIALQSEEIYNKYMHYLTGCEHFFRKGISNVGQFTKFILAEIFPGGWLPSIPTVHEYAEKVGFRVTAVQSLQLHYARTLDMWATALEANKDQAIAIQSQTVYDRYMKYLTGCAKLFRQGYTDVDQFTLEK
ncbi:class I SAM-dependent methyltransferase, partial [Mycobacterium tuberculosis]|uniref:class I SAM-dependent methyltransferase n=2 Tax=Mycobacterium tuberculosis TaxID=1773 RepID=UPI001F3F03E7